MKCLLLAVAAGAGLLTTFGPTLAQTWQQTSAPVEGWSSVASSADGAKLVAVAWYNYDVIYTSTNSGVNWILSAPTGGWNQVSSSADGTKLVVVGAFISVSTNAGATWTDEIGATDIGWQSVASSADGTKLAAASNPVFAPGLPALIYTSTNAGDTWAPTGSPATNWAAIASSADGSKLVAAASSLICISTNSGATWQAAQAPDAGWTSVACSADGTVIVAAAASGAIYVSHDAGATWRGTSIPFQAWYSVASSADGTRLAAAFRGVPQGGFIFTSTDSGVTWKSNNAPNLTWTAVASSADGCKMAATAEPRGIYTWQTTPHPVLNVAASGTNLVLSWIIPSQAFVLQENADLTTTNWTDVASAPVLNLTNLQNQVTAPLSTARRFYRLRAVTD